MRFWRLRASQAILGASRGLFYGGWTAFCGGGGFFVAEIAGGAPYLSDYGMALILPGAGGIFLSWLMWGRNA